MTIRIINTTLALASMSAMIHDLIVKSIITTFALAMTHDPINKIILITTLALASLADMTHDQQDHPHHRQTISIIKNIIIIKSIIIKSTITTLALASLAASASAAMALCSCTGSRTSFTFT